VNNQRFFYLLSILGIVFLLSCNKEDKTVGLEVQPEQNRLKINTLNIQNFQTYTSGGFALETSRGTPYLLLGSINDTHFGKTTAFADVQYILSTVKPNFGTDPKLISTTLFLSIPSYYGNISTALKYQIYTSKLDVDADASYMSNKDMSSYIGELIADTNITVNSNQKILQIHLDKTMSDGKKWGQNILEADATTLSSNGNFKKIFKGLYLSVDTNFSEQGLIWKCNLNSKDSYIKIEYSFTNDEGNVDTTIFNLQFNNKTGRFNTYTNNPNPLKTILGKTGENKIYISGLAGVQGNISLSSLLAWRDSAKIVIYKAELIAKAEAINSFNMPEKLLLRVNKSDTSIHYVDDYRGGANTNYDGTYHAKDTAYHWVLTRHIQRFINNEQNDSLIMIYPEDTTKTKLDRVLLFNGSDNAIRLRITYSKI